MPTRYTRLLFIVGLAIAAAAHAGPTLVLSQADVDLGELAQRTTTAVVVSIKNTGDADLVISEVKTSCGCTAAMLDRETIPPGESGDLKVTFDSRNYTGKKRRELWIMSNDTETPRAVLTLHMDIIPDLRVAPEVVDFGIVPIGTTPTITATLTAKPGATIPALRKVVYDAELLTVTTAGGGDQPMTITMTLKEGLPPGRLAQVVILDWVDDEMHDTSMDVYGQIKAPIVITPDAIYIAGSTDDELSRARRVVVKSPDGDDFAVLQVADMPEWLTAKIHPAKEGYQEIDFVADPMRVPQQYRGTVTVKLDHPTVKEYPISIRLFKVKAPQ